MNKKGFTLVELMVVVAIIAILAAVALPMYGTFRQKGRVSVVLKSCTGATASLQNHFMDYNNFDNITVSTNGGSITANGARLGSGLPEVPNVEWSITTIDTTTVQINWNFTATCPIEFCNGYWELTCDSGNDRCDIRIHLDDSNTLGMNVN